MKGLFLTACIAVWLISQPCRASEVSNPTTLASYGLSSITGHGDRSAADCVVIPELLQVGQHTIYAADFYGDGLIWFALDQAAVEHALAGKPDNFSLPAIQAVRMLAHVNTHVSDSSTAAVPLQQIAVAAQDQQDNLTIEPGSDFKVRQHVLRSEIRRSTKRLKGRALMTRINHAQQSALLSNSRTNEDH